jgi:hypothetical protein
MILEDQRISAKKIVETLEIPWEQVGLTIHDVVNIIPNAKWVPEKQFLSISNRTQQATWPDL